MLKYSVVAITLNVCKRVVISETNVAIIQNY